MFSVSTSFDFCSAKNVSNYTLLENKIKPLRMRLFYKAFYEARWASEFYSHYKWSNFPNERKATFIESYIKFLQTYYEHLIVFLVPVILFVLTLILSLHQLMKSYKDLTNRHRLIKRKYVKMSVVAAKYKVRMEKAEALLKFNK